MLGSRTIKSLTALLLAMTLGVLILMVMETSPVRPPAVDLAAQARPTDGVGVVFDTDVRLQPIKWRHIVVHATGAEGPGIAARCHFIVQPTATADGGVVFATPLWRRQTQGHHVFVPGYDYNADSVGICLMGDFARRAPAAEQMDALIALVQTVQRECGIGSDRVFLHKHLTGSRSPGALFPDDVFSAHLLRPTR